jgi:hypothetical protein
MVAACNANQFGIMPFFYPMVEFSGKTEGGYYREKAT